MLKHMPQIPRDFPIIIMCVLSASSLTFKASTQIAKRGQSENVHINQHFDIQFE